MTDTLAADRQSPTPSRSRLMLRRWFPAPVRVILVIVLALGCYALGWHTGVHEIDNLRSRNEQREKDNKNLSDQNSGQAAQIAILQTQLKNVQDELNAIMPLQSTFEVNSNQSRLVASGHLTVGLIGAPSNDKVNININGEQHSVVAGDVITIALPTTCQVQVKSFELFRAQIAESCTTAKPQTQNGSQ